MTSHIPEGFKPVKVGSNFIAHTGPLYAKWEGTRLQLGFRVEERHINPLNICHGGMPTINPQMDLPPMASRCCG
jgi:acyl-coenzyme A thioesterase PaaI-like protein